MADTDSIRPYRASDDPTLPDNGRYLSQELQRIQNSIAQIVVVMKKLEARMAAHGI